MVLPKPPQRSNGAHHLNHYAHHPPLSPCSVTSNASSKNDEPQNGSSQLRPLPMLYLKGSPMGSPTHASPRSLPSKCSPCSLMYNRTRFATAAIAMLLCIGVSTQSMWQLSRWTSLTGDESSTYVARQDACQARNATDGHVLLFWIPCHPIPLPSPRESKQPLRKRRRERSRIDINARPHSFGKHPRLLQVEDSSYGQASRELHKRRVRFSRFFRRRRKGDAFVSYYYNATAEEINEDYPEPVYRDFEQAFYEQCEAVVTSDEEMNVGIKPTCNVMHELDLEENTRISLLSMAGSWRSVWKVDETVVTENSRSKPKSKSKDGGNATESDDLPPLIVTNNTLILKLLMLHREFDTESFHSHAVDAVTMERLTASPYVVSEYGYCGQTVLTEYAPNTTRDALNDADLTYLTRLRIARDLARGLADLHAYRRLDFEGNETGPPPPALFAHHDINIANTVRVVRPEDDLGPPPPNMTSDERRRRAQFVHVQWNDFNLGIWTRRQRPDAPSGVDCRVPVRYEGPLWRSPEEIRNATLVRADACDVYSMGNLLFQILNKRQPWTHLEPVRPTLDEISAFKLDGTFPTLDATKFVAPNGTHHDRLEVRALLAAMNATFHNDPEQRPTAWRLARGLGTAHKWVETLTKRSPRRTDEELAALFREG